MKTKTSLRAGTIVLEDEVQTRSVVHARTDEGGHRADKIHRDKIHRERR